MLRTEEAGYPIFTTLEFDTPHGVLHMEKSKDSTHTQNGQKPTCKYVEYFIY
jgi:hypothetical protein